MGSQESNANAGLKAASVRELALRFGFAAEEPCCEKCTDLTERWPPIYRRLALVLHPDRGGNAGAMQAVNELDEAMKN